MKRIIPLMTSLFVFLVAEAQQVELFHAPVIENGKTLTFPWSGGMGAPQFYQADLNNDGLLDIFVFDRVGSVLSAFINDNNGYYRQDNSILSHFPRMTEWVVMVDYNKDGVPDLFTFSIQETSSIRVFKGKWINNQLAFDQITWADQADNKRDVLHVHNRNTLAKTPFEIYVFNVDVPGFYDVDGDGDLDILTFQQNGFTLNYYQNRSVELGFGTDSLIFVLEDDCFGKFWESGVSPELDLSDDPNRCNRPGSFNDEDEDSRDLRHAGSTVTPIDINHDGLVDLLLGDISFSDLVLAINGGSIDNAWMTEQDFSFPSYNVPVNISFFPAAYIVDVDLDGKMDLIVAANDRNAFDDKDIAWYYRNVGDESESIFELQQRDFLVENMIDLGKGANPTFFDYNGDGLLDIVVGVYDVFTGETSFDSRLFLFENIGTASQPAFELVDDDYLGFSALTNSNGSFEFTPHFADMDGDGDLDLIVGEFGGQLFYAENLSGVGQEAVFGPIEYGWQNIRTESIMVPYVYDMDGDGLPDLLIGDRRGEVRFFKNIGTSSEPLFNPDLNEPPNIRRMGDFTVRGPLSFLGMSAPTVVFDGNMMKMAIGSSTEGIHIYDVANRNDLTQSFIRKLDEPITQLRNGIRIRPAFGDVTGDGKLEMLVGNMRGGLTLYRTEYQAAPLSTSVINPSISNLQWSMFPNPVSDLLQIELEYDAPHRLSNVQISVYDMLGRMVLSQNRSGQTIEMNTLSLRPGVYFLELSVGGMSERKKFIKQ